MPRYEKLPKDIDEVDVIIAGGGSTGCVIASRISDADPSLSVLVLESGPDGTQDPTVAFPLLFAAHIAPDAKFTRMAASQKESALADRQMFVPSGNILGGGSAINMLTYSRPTRFDLNAWNMLGWTGDEILPYMKKFATYHGKGNPEEHGDSGPIEVSEGPLIVRAVQDEVIAAATKMGYPEVNDLQTIDGAIGSQRNVKYVSRTGERQSVTNSYLHPRLKDGNHANLHVATNTIVERVLFDDAKRASGVVCRNSGPEGADSELRTVRARRLVVVSAGTLSSPLILERSGLGDPAILEKAGVPLVAENAGVGHDFQDHDNLISAYHTSLRPEETADALARGEIDVGKAIQEKDPILGWTFMDTICQVRLTDEEVAALGANYQKHFNETHSKEPTKPSFNFCAINGYPLDISTVTPGQYMSVSCFMYYPLARGHVHITGPKYADPCDFATGQLSTDIDLLTLRAAYKIQREIIRRTSFFRGELPHMHPKFPEHSAAALTKGGLEGDIRKLQYSKEDDELIDQFVRENVQTTWHGLGTCKMGKRDEGGVVDERLDVYGVKGLKVADLSVVPGNVSCNTYSVALLIGEKTADLIIEELGLSQ